MAFVVSRQRKIFYDLDGERGPYLLLYPSLWMDLQSWEEAGYLDVLQQEYRVLRIDPLGQGRSCLLYTSPSPRDNTTSRMPSSA